MEQESSSQESSYWGPSYANLPTEIIIKLFSYLHASDIKAVSQTCRRWYEVSQSYSCQSKLIIRFHKIYLSDYDPPLNIFLKSNRTFSSIAFEQTDVGSITKFLKKFGSNIEDVTFNAVDMTRKQFKEILENLKQIKKLTIANCTAFFMEGLLFDFDVNDQILLSKALVDVKLLSLPNNRYLSDANLYRITVMTPNIEELNLSNCQIAFHHSLYQRFYPKGKTNAPSESILTFEYVLKIIKVLVISLRALDLSQTLIGNSALASLSNIKELKLRKLILNHCAQLTRSSLMAFLDTQSSTLTHLELSHSNQICDSSAKQIAEQLKNLEVLKLSHCKAITGDFLEHVCKMKNLKVLDLSNCISLTINSATKMENKPNKILQELYLSATNVSESFLITCSELYPNLSVLDIGHCYNCVSDTVLQAIIKNLMNLLVLNLEYCTKITDTALTSIEVPKDKKIENEKNYDYFHQRSASIGNDGRLYQKISLRSKAEQDIIDDANRKRVMFAICEQGIQVDKNVFHEYSIRRLEGLRSLNLNACSRISDVSLIYGFKFRELKCLALSNCQQISHNGIQYLVTNCPSIEELHLANCHNINDRAIKMITSGLKRLTILVIDGCTKLTDHSLDYIAVNCTSLKELSVRCCRLMCVEPAIRLTTVSSLRIIHTDGGTTYA